nr:S8 family serine peptidase [Anaerolineae bacterium]
MAETPESVGDGAIQWNITQIRADLAWSILDLNGSGVTVGIMDTGVDWQHPSLEAQYRGYKPGGLPVHEGNWICTTDQELFYPVDAHGHGTHVAGTAVGSLDSSGQAIGVAPGASWI